MSSTPSPFPISSILLSLDEDHPITDAPKTVRKRGLKRVSAAAENNDVLSLLSITHDTRQPISVRRQAIETLVDFFFLCPDANPRVHLHLGA